MSGSDQQIASSDKFVEDLKTVTQSCVVENESIQDVTLEDSDLHVYVNLSKVDPAPLTLEDLAITRTSSITDAVLKLTQYDTFWITITVDFGDLGQIKNSKDDMQRNESGGRYFPSENFILE